MLWLFTIPFTALTSHYGTICALLTCPPAGRLSAGPITREALLYGLAGGLALMTLLLVFAVFNVAVDQARLLRMTPGFVYQLGVVTAIAVAFVPQMVASWQAIREAQQVRGHRVRGLRDLLPLIMPLLVTALERAMQLAESMEARGFGGQARAASTATYAEPVGDSVRPGCARRRAGWDRLLAREAACWPARCWSRRLALLGWSFWDQGRRVHRSRYRRWLWARPTGSSLAASLLSATIWLAAWLLRGDWLLLLPLPALFAVADFPAAARAGACAAGRAGAAVAADERRMTMTNSDGELRFVIVIVTGDP